MIMSKIFLKYIPIHIHNFEHSRVIMNMKLSSHGFLFHINIVLRRAEIAFGLVLVVSRLLSVSGACLAIFCD